MPMFLFSVLVSNLVFGVDLVRRNNVLSYNTFVLFWSLRRNSNAPANKDTRTNLSYEPTGIGCQPGINKANPPVKPFQGVWFFDYEQGHCERPCSYLLGHSLEAQGILSTKTIHGIYSVNPIHVHPQVPICFCQLD